MTVLRIKIYRLKTDAVAEIKNVGVRVVVHNLNHIGHRKRTVFVTFGAVQIKHLIHIFETFAADLALINLVVDFRIDSKAA